MKVYYDMAMPNKLNWLPEYDWVVTNLQWHARTFCFFFSDEVTQTRENEMHVALAILRMPPSRN